MSLSPKVTLLSSIETLVLLDCVLSHSVVSDSFMTLQTVACKAFLSIEFSRQKYWSGLPFPSLGDLPNPQVEPTSTVSPTLLANSLPTEPSIREAYNRLGSTLCQCDLILV